MLEAARQFQRLMDEVIARLEGERGQLDDKRLTGTEAAGQPRATNAVIPSKLCSEGSRDGETRISGPRSLGAKLHRDDAERTVGRAAVGAAEAA